MATATPKAGGGEINPATLYRIESLKAAAGVGEWAIRQMRRNGLKIRYIAGKAFVLGSDFIDYITSNAKDCR